MNYIIGFIIGCLVVFGGYLLWNAGERADLQTCKEKYGNEYVLGHSNANSSIKWCVSPDGAMKEL